MDLRLDGKTALVTGGSRGIGKAIAKAFADSGADVMITSRKAESCEETANEIGCIWEAGHVGNPDDAERIVDACIERLGGVDILVNNASALWWHTVSETPTKKVRFFRFFTRKILLALYCVVRVPLGSRITTSCEEFLIIPIRSTLQYIP